MQQWTTISKPIKNHIAGLSNYMIYLEDNQHKNHKGKTNEIIPIFGDSKIFRQSVVKNCAEVDYKNQLKRKGGRPLSSMAQSFVFSLPPGVTKPTKKQWEKIAEVLILKICTQFKIPPQHAEKYIFSNVHDQSNPHLNLVVSKTRNGEVFKDLQRSQIIKSLKLSFTTQYQLLTGYNPNDYQVIKKNSPKKRKPRWLYEKEKREELERLEKEKINNLPTEEPQNETKSIEEVFDFANRLQKALVIPKKPIIKK